MRASGHWQWCTEVHCTKLLVPLTGQQAGTLPVGDTVSHTLGGLPTVHTTQPPARPSHRTSKVQRRRVWPTDGWFSRLPHAELVPALCRRGTRREHLRTVRATAIGAASHQRTAGDEAQRCARIGPEAVALRINRAHAEDIPAATPWVPKAQLRTRTAVRSCGVQRAIGRSAVFRAQCNASVRPRRRWRRGRAHETAGVSASMTARRSRVGWGSRWRIHTSSSAKKLENTYAAWHGSAARSGQRSLSGPPLRRPAG